MAIDARVTRVDVKGDGSGTIFLEPRPADDKGPASVPGQNQLRFLLAPGKVQRLEGKNIWGGSGFIMLGARKIADRAGYEMIVFESDGKFEQALDAYRWITKPETR